MKKLFKNLISTAVCSAACIQVSSAASDTALLNLVTKKEGIHRVSFEQLKQTGADLSGFNVNDIAISRDGYSISRFVSDQAKDGFGAGDFIDFLAEDVYNRYTTDAVYTLEINSSLTKPSFSLASIPIINHDPSETAQATVVLEDQNEFWVSSPDLADPYIMGTVYASSAPVSKEFRMDLPGLSASGDKVEFTAEILGATDTSSAIDHSVEIRINGATVAKKQFAGKKAQLITADVEPSLLREEGNVIEVVLPLDIDVAYDLVGVDSFSFSYPRTLSANGESFKVETSSDYLTVSNLQDQDAVYESVQGNLVRTAANNSVATVRSAIKDDTSSFYVVTGELPTPELRSIVETQDITSGSAEYLVIAHPNFIDENLQQLIDLRQGRFSTKVVDVEQVYTQFGNSVAEAAPIQDYIQFAAKNLDTKMVLLVGGDTHDYHGYLGDSVSHIPTIYKVVGGLNTTVNHAPTDAAYGDLDSDGIPDLAIGRLPVRTSTELENVVAKIIAFEQRDYKGTAVFAADNIDNGYSHSFAEEAESIITSLPAQIGETVETAFAEEIGTQQAGDKIIDTVNKGVELTAYLGHSSMYKWASEGLLDTNDLAGLTNDAKPTIVAQYGCWNTMFTMPDGNTMAHVALLDSKNGAATVMGASTLTLANSEVALGKALFETMYVPGKTLGEALIEAKQNISAKKSISDVLLGWQIIGDPAIVMNPAIGGNAVAVSSAQ